ncbi:MAG: substrate-binding domain-containing protein, partial [Anaerolineaceae bacterium]
MFQKFYKILVVLILAAVTISACTPVSAATPQTVEVTRIVAGTPQIIEITSTAAPTLTPQPAAPTPLPAGSIQINAAGATFPLPLYTQWTYAYQYVDPSVAINYQGIGSGGGKKAIIDGTVDFAGSDSLLLDTEYAAGKDLQMYPIVASA